MHESIHAPTNLTDFPHLDGFRLTAIRQQLSAAKAEILCQFTNPNT